MTPARVIAWRSQASDQMPPLWSELELGCVYGLNVGIDTIDEAVYFRRRDACDELWVDDGLGGGTMAFRRYRACCGGDYSARRGPCPSGPPAAVQNSFPRILSLADGGPQNGLAGRMLVNAPQAGYRLMMERTQ